MAKYDYATPKDILESIEKKKKEGYFIQRINDKKELAQYYEIVLKDRGAARRVYEEIRKDLEKPLTKSPHGSAKVMASFLRELQNPKTGSFVEYPTIFSREIERAKHILRSMKQYGLKPKYPLKFLERVDTGIKLRRYFKSLLYDFSKNNEDELNLANTGLPDIKKRGFHRFSDDWEDAFFECIEMWQDPETGYWGPWVRKGKRIIKRPDLSTTFHMIRAYYNKDNLRLNNPKRDLKHKREIIATTWKLKNKSYPYGWLEKGKWSTHHNFDVAEIFLYLFDEIYEIDVEEGTKEEDRVRELFSQFLRWNLKKNLQKDGGFIGHYPNIKTPSVYTTNLAILLLRAIGYFSGVYRMRVWDGVRLPVNSYRIYKKELSKEEFDTSRLKCIVYTRKCLPDPLDTRLRIYKYWSKHKSENPGEAINIASLLKFEEFMPRKIKITRQNKQPEIKEDEILMAVDKFGGIVWIV